MGVTHCHVLPCMRQQKRKRQVQLCKVCRLSIARWYTGLSNAYWTVPDVMMIQETTHTIVEAYGVQFMTLLCEPSVSLCSRLVNLRLASKHSYSYI